MSADVLVIDIGNDFRRDDGVGLAAAAEIANRGLFGVHAISTIGEPGSILEGWAGVPLAVAVDSTMGEGSIPDRNRRWTPGDAAEPNVVSSHAMGLAQTHALGQALGQVPQKLLVFTVDVADVSHGVTLTPAVAAEPTAVEAILAELARPQ